MINLTDNEFEQAKLCEIAYVASAMRAYNIIDISYDYDMTGLYKHVYKPIFDEYNECLVTNNFINDEEAGYISAFAQRKLKELYGKN